MLLVVRVQPRASKNALRLGGNGQLRVAVTAPPVDDAANTAVRAYMADSLGIGKGRVQICAGLRSREKTLKISDITASDVIKKLVPILGKC